MASNNATPSSNPRDDHEDEEEAQQPLSPEEEATLVSQTSSHRSKANLLFAASSYRQAITVYTQALSTCPTYLHYDLAVLRSNLAACHLKLEQWQEALKEATSSLELLEKCEQEAEGEKEKESKARPEDKTETKDKGKYGHQDDEVKEKETEVAGKKTATDDSDVEEEIISQGATKAGPSLGNLDSGLAINPQTQDREDSVRKRKDDVQRMRAKSLMRRARARTELGGWSNLTGAEEDYKLLSGMKSLGPADRKMVAQQLKVLPARTKAAQEKETAEMWGKLKELGDGILKPFGLSTDNFKMQKDEKTGGYSMSFKQSGPS